MYAYSHKICLRSQWYQSLNWCNESNFYLTSAEEKSKVEGKHAFVVQCTFSWIFFAYDFKMHTPYTWLTTLHSKCHIGLYSLIIALTSLLWDWHERTQRWEKIIHIYPVAKKLLLLSYSIIMYTFLLRAVQVPFQENSVSVNTVELMSMFWSINNPGMISSPQRELLKRTIYKNYNHYKNQNDYQQLSMCRLAINYAVLLWLQE